MGLLNKFRDQREAMIKKSLGKISDEEYFEKSGQGRWITTDDGNRAFLGGDGKLRYTKEEIESHKKEEGKDKESKQITESKKEDSAPKDKKDSRHGDKKEGEKSGSGDVKFTNTEKLMLKTYRGQMPIKGSDKEISDLADKIAKLDGEDERDTSHFAEAIQLSRFSKEDQLKDVESFAKDDLKAGREVDEENIDRMVKLGVLDKKDLKHVEEANTLAKKVDSLPYASKMILSKALEVHTSQDTPLKEMNAMVSKILSNAKSDDVIGITDSIKQVTK